MIRVRAWYSTREGKSLTKYIQSCPRNQLTQHFIFHGPLHVHTIIIMTRARLGNVNYIDNVTLR